MPITDYHAVIRDAILGAIRPVITNLNWEAIDDPEDATRLTLPVGVACCVGPEEERDGWGTNQRDGIGFGVMLALFATGTTRGENDQGPPTATRFRRLIHNTFHMKRLSGVTEVGFCEVRDSGGIYQEQSPAFQRLKTELVVQAIGRFPRS